MNLSRKLGLSQGEFYKFKAKYGGTSAAKLRAVTDKVAKLKRLTADTVQDNVVLKDIHGKN